MLKMLVEGKCVDMKVNTSSNGQKTYYTIFVHTGGRSIVSVGLPQKLYSEYAIGSDVVLECDFYVNYERKMTSLYIKE